MPEYMKQRMARRDQFVSQMCSICGKHGFGLRQIEGKYFCPLCAPKPKPRGAVARPPRGPNRRAHPYRRKKRGTEGALDPMDPSAYSTAKRGGWGVGLNQVSSGKAADVTATGALFEQRRLPSPGEVLRKRAEAHKKAARQ